MDPLLHLCPQRYSSESITAWQPAAFSGRLTRAREVTLKWHGPDGRDDFSMYKETECRWPGVYQNKSRSGLALLIPLVTVITEMAYVNAKATIKSNSRGKRPQHDTVHHIIQRWCPQHCLHELPSFIDQNSFIKYIIFIIIFFKQIQAVKKKRSRMTKETLHTISVSVIMIEKHPHVCPNNYPAQLVH